MKNIVIEFIIKVRVNFVYCIVIFFKIGIGKIIFCNNVSIVRKNSVRKFISIFFVIVGKINLLLNFKI